MKKFLALALAVAGGAMVSGQASAMVLCNSIDDFRTTTTCSFANAFMSEDLHCMDEPVLSQYDDTTGTCIEPTGLLGTASSKTPSDFSSGHCGGEHNGHYKIMESRDYNAARLHDEDTDHRYRKDVALYRHYCGDTTHTATTICAQANTTLGNLCKIVGKCGYLHNCSYTCSGSFNGDPGFSEE